MPQRNKIKLVAVLVGLWLCTPLQAAQVRIAVASNFAPTLQRLASEFEANSGHTLTISVASSGKHFAQIIHGAPFDIFLSADAQRPALLVQRGLASPQNVQSYAFGRLVLWSASQLSSPLSAQSLLSPQVRKIAIANPKLAPYGVAAQQAIDSLGLSDATKGKLVRGENINQAFQFVLSGNAQLGFVAYSQIIQYQQSKARQRVGLGQHADADVDFWIVPESQHQPIQQDAVLLNDNAAATQFWQFLFSPSARQMIRESGYKSP